MNDKVTLLEGNFSANPSDNWGQTIIMDFLADGGFGELKSKEVAHNKFSELIQMDFDPDADWHLRCNALAIWAYICIELEITASDLDKLAISIYVAMEKSPGGESQDWLGQLAFDLLLFKHSDKTSSSDVEITRRNLFKTIKLAAKSFHENPINKGIDFYNGVRLSADSFGRFLGTENLQDVKQLSNTKKMLLELGDAGVNEAFYILVILGMGEKGAHESWLESATKGVMPTKQLAAFYLGYLLQTTNNFRKSKYFLEMVRFPSEDDSEYDVLSRLAMKAKLKALTDRNIENMVFDGQKDSFHLWNKVSNNVTSQWESVERCGIRVQEIVDIFKYKTQDASIQGSKIDHKLSDQVELPEHIRSLTLETGRLIEAFLKWSLSRWFFVDKNKLKVITDMDVLSGPNYSDLIGPILGSNIDGIYINLEDLFHSCGINTTSTLKSKDVKRLYDCHEGRDVWKIRTNLITLVVGNALVAKCNDNHPFRHTPSEMLIDMVDVFNTAYYFRNDNSHYTVPSIGNLESEANEAVFWGVAVRNRIDRFMSHNVDLLDKGIDRIN